MALVVLSVVEQRLDAVRAVLAGADVVEVAARLGVHRSTLHRWVARYLSEQLGGLADRSHRPHACPRQVADAVEAVDVGLGREVVDDPGTQPGPAAEARRREPAIAGSLERGLQSILVGVQRVAAMPSSENARIVTTVASSTTHGCR